MSAAPTEDRFTVQAEQILASQRRDARRFAVGVRVSYALLLLALAYAFSGSQFTVGGLKFTTISLDWIFIRSHWFFIFNGVWLTILLSVLSILLATVLSLLGALGRLSKSPPAYALATFYISLIRGTPLLLQVVFFFWPCRSWAFGCQAYRPACWRCSAAGSTLGHPAHRQPVHRHAEGHFAYLSNGIRMGALVEGTEAG